MTRVSVTEQSLFPVLIASLTALAWLQLSLWSLSPYARFLNHEILEHLPFTLSLNYFALLALFVLGWVLMTVAMMLPTTYPLIALFRRVVAPHADRRLLTSLLISGYLAVWAVFGVAAHIGDSVVHRLVHLLPWLEENAWLIGSSTLVVAGTYQFTSLKYRCLDKCRSPLSFVTEHWRGTAERSQSFLLGVRHGAFCVGCCWHLMLLMFAFACGNVAWMLLLGTIMATEKNVSWGRRLSRPLGASLLLAAVVLAFAGAVT